LEWGFDSAPGALAPIRVLLSRSINAYQPHPTHSLAHRDFAVSATYTRCLRCAGAPRRPTSGSELSLHIPSRHAALYALGEIEIRFIQITDSDIGLRRDLSGSALPGILPSASSRARFRGFLVRISLRPVQLLASLDGSDQDFSQPPRLLHPGFPRVSHLSRCWISLRQFLDCSVGGTFTHWNGSYPRCTRSVRARLRIRLLRGMSGVEASIGIGVQNAGWRNPPVQDWGKTFPTHLCALTAADQNTVP
jgi:hypothetical protein